MLRLFRNYVQTNVILLLDVSLDAASEELNWGKSTWAPLIVVTETVM